MSVSLRLRFSTVVVELGMLDYSPIPTAIAAPRAAERIETLEPTPKSQTASRKRMATSTPSEETLCQNQKSTLSVFRKGSNLCESLLRDFLPLFADEISQSSTRKSDLASKTLLQRATQLGLWLKYVIYQYLTQSSHPDLRKVRSCECRGKGRLSS